MVRGLCRKARGPVELRERVRRDLDIERAEIVLELLQRPRAENDRRDGPLALPGDRELRRRAADPSGQRLH